MNEHEKYFKIWEKRFMEQEEYIEQVRSIKHDIEAHMIVLQYYLDAEMYEDAKQYLKTMRSIPMQKNSRSNVDVGNQLIDVLIEEYISRDLEIAFVCEGKIPKEIGISSYDLCILFSNIISNAVEACEKLCLLSKEIHMRLRTEKDRFIIVVENPMEWEIEKEQLGRESTKADTRNHGYGIKNMRDVIMRYEGKIDLEAERNLFRVKIEISLK